MKVVVGEMPLQKGQRVVNEVQDRFNEVFKVVGRYFQFALDISVKSCRAFNVLNEEGQRNIVKAAVADVNFRQSSKAFKKLRVRVRFR